MIPQEIINFITPALATGSIVWGLAMWISGRFNSTNDRIQKAQEVILDKLAYHERHDDVRFQNITNELTSIKIRNASKDGHYPSLKEKD